MGRLSQAFWYALADKAPTEHEMRCVYSHISKTKDLKEFRKAIRKQLKEQDQQQLFK